MKAKVLVVQYESPETRCYDIQCEGVLCQSVEDGKTGGFDEFTFEEGDAF